MYDTGRCLTMGLGDGGPFLSTNLENYPAECYTERYVGSCFPIIELIVIYITL